MCGFTCVCSIMWHSKSDEVFDYCAIVLSRQATPVEDQTILIILNTTTTHITRRRGTQSRGKTWKVIRFFLLCVSMCPESSSSSWWTWNRRQSHSTTCQFQSWMGSWGRTGISRHPRPANHLTQITTPKTTTTNRLAHFAPHITSQRKSLFQNISFKEYKRRADMTDPKRNIPNQDSLLKTTF